MVKNPPHLLLLLLQHSSQQRPHHPQAVAPQRPQLARAVGGWRLQLGVVGAAQALPAGAGAPAQGAGLVQLGEAVQACIAVQQAPAAVQQYGLHRVVAAS
jgi:hypothetical protein